ncbi:MAG TPA: hypothetical protein VEV17_04675 [Bryobacteraceae bacterium]|nr:hypothetical protein [Bryobacteraceae bacterium]
MPSSKRLTGFAAALAAALMGGSTARAAVLLNIDLPKDSPVALLSAEHGDSSETARGGAMLLDLHAALSLRNSTQRRIHGVTLLITAQDVTPGGRGSVTITSLDVGPGEAFPVRIDLRLLRPLQASNNVPVQVGLDGVLFDDLSFYGLDKLGSRRNLTLSEFEARRDRKYFKSLLAEGGPQRLQQEMIESMAHSADRPSLDVQMVRGGRATNFEPEKQVQFAFLRLPDSPIEPMEGMARIAGNEARAPRLEVKNRSDRPIRYLELGWILHDRGGQEFLAGSVPAELSLAPGQKSPILENTTLKFPQHGGQPLAIESMTGFVSSVEFADGSVWIPSRADLGMPELQRVMAPSDEEQRLVQIYRKKGLKALIAELNRF